jgi:Chitin recognition protein
MGVAFHLVYRPGAANTALLLVILLLQTACSVFAAEIRCDSTQIGYNAASQRCPATQICTARGVCELLRQDAIGFTRARQFRPIPTLITQSPISAQRRCGKHFAGARCDPVGTIGSCCSRRGWCGSTAAHCSSRNGCQHGCKSNRALVLGPRYKPGNDIEQTSEPRINTHQIFASFDKPLSAPEHATPGKFRVAGDSGVPAMHAALMPNGKVVFLDKIENYTQLQFESGEYAYSSEWDPVSGEVTALAYEVKLIRLLPVVDTGLPYTRPMPSAVAAHFLLPALWSRLVEMDL